MSDADGFGGYDGDGADSSGHADFDSSNDSFHTGGKRKGGVCPFEMVNLGSALAAMGHLAKDHPLLACADYPALRKVRQPSVVETSSGFQTLVWPHGEVDIKLIVQLAALRFGLFDLLGRKNDIQQTDITENTIKDTTPFDARENNTPMPTGWFPGVTGSTRTWSKYYQLGSKRGFWRKFDVDLDRKVHLVVQGATWFFNQTGDFETRVSFSVNALPVWRNGEWRKDEAFMLEHKRMAATLAHDLFHAVKQVPPSAHSLRMRYVQAEAEQRRAESQAMVPAPAPAAPLVGSTMVSAVDPSAKGPGPGRRAGTGGDDPITTDMNSR